MKYAFKLDLLQKKIAEYHLANYQNEKRELEQLENELVPLPITRYDLVGHSTDISRTTETTAIKLLYTPYVRRMATGIEAVEKALQYADDTDMKIITLVYWKKSHSVEGAAMEAFIGKSDAYYRINKILAVVAYFLGYIKEDFKKPRARGGKASGTEIQRIINA